MYRGYITEWTKRGNKKLSTADCEIIKSAAGIAGAAPLWATGEQHVDAISRQHWPLLMKNALLPDPLFVFTAKNHLKLARYDFQTVMSLLSPEQRQRTLRDTMKQLNLAFEDQNMTDFYESLIAALAGQAPGGRSAFLYFTNDQTGFDSIYVSALLLFHKPGYLDITAPEFFADMGVKRPNFGYARFRVLTDDENSLILEAQEKGQGTELFTNLEIITLQQLWVGTRDKLNERR
ncbi:hypothetical protein FACS189445_1360 [Spirochaetia bacterium]|nr:hypothetical protein FACS189445_1360 [Spirochaetia bacterium]